MNPYPAYLDLENGYKFKITDVKMLLTQPYKNDTYMTNAKRPTKNQFYIREKRSNPLGGLTLFAQFCKSLSLRRHLQCCVRWPEYHNKRYYPVDLLLAHIFAITAGIGRIENTQSLVHNGFIPSLLGLPEFPHRDTLRTFLWRFNSENLQSLQRAHDKFRACLFQRLRIIYSAIIDADMTVLTVFGHQESAQMGYNPKYHGDDSLGVRSDSSFSISVSAQRFSALEYFNASQRTLVAAGRMGQARQPQYPATSQAIPAAGIIFQDSKNDFKGKTLNLNRFANTFFANPTSIVKKELFIAVFQVEYIIPLPIPNKETPSTEEVLCMYQIGSPNRI